MSKLLLLVTILLSFTAFNDASAQTGNKPPLFISKAVLALKIPTWTWKNENYTIQITRQFQNPQEEALLKKAEAIYPDRDRILAAAKKQGREANLKPVKGEALWWGSSFDGVRIPYAVTAASVIYYYRLIQDFRRNDFSGSSGFKMSRAKLKYASSIAHHKEYTIGTQKFRDVHVAKLELEWDSWCGNLCAMYFNKKRTVILHPNGAVTVAGDGLESIIVS